jgi:hypothetical protein
LIDRETNIRIGKHAPSDYLEEIRTALGVELLGVVLDSHMLPSGKESPLWSDDFDAFLTWRLERLDEVLIEHVGARQTSAPEVDPQISKLDARVEAVELRLRELIAARLDRDGSSIPQHIMVRVDERIDAASAKHPGPTPRQGDGLMAKLEYFDLRDLQNVICAKTLWPAFERPFGTKEQLNVRFDQLAELRNMIRHSRATNVVTVKDGEAGLLWFDRVFDGVEPATEADRAR